MNAWYEWCRITLLLVVWLPLLLVTRCKWSAFHISYAPQGSVHRSYFQPSTIVRLSIIHMSIPPLTMYTYSLSPRSMYVLTYKQHSSHSPEYITSSFLPILHTPSWLCISNKLYCCSSTATSAPEQLYLCMQVPQGLRTARVSGYDRILFVRSFARPPRSAVLEHKPPPDTLCQDNIVNCAHSV